MPRMMAVIVTLALATAPAAAQDRTGPSPVDATLLSVGATAAGAGLLYLAPHAGVPTAASVMLLGITVLTVGPSVGFFHIGERRRGMATVGLRVGALAAAGVGIAKQNDALIAGALTAYVGSALFDIATVGITASRYAAPLDIDVDVLTGAVTVQAVLPFTGRRGPLFQRR